MRRPAALVTAIAFTILWLAMHPALPQQPTGDVYTSLGVARHLARGDGLTNDAVYPLFTAYRWGREMPQPLVHRPPGLAFVLLPAWWLSGSDPVRVEALIRPTMALLLGLAALLGLLGLQRHDRNHAGPAWLLLLLMNPLLGLAVSWGWTEVPSGLLLLFLWLRLRRRAPAQSGPAGAAGYAALCAALALIRTDLLWVPVLWWFLAAATARRRRCRRATRRTLLAAVVGVALLAPWFAHVTRHAGSPLANPLADAVQLDLGEAWWDYPLLRSRTPLPLAANLRQNFGPAMSKTFLGIRVSVRSLGLWLPWLFWAAVVAAWGLQTRRRLQRGHAIGRAVGPAGLLALTAGLMVIQYGLFSQETRHMLPLMPLLAWEGVLLIDTAMRRHVRLRRPFARGTALAALVGLALVITPPGLGGDEGNLEEARRLSGRVDEVTAAARTLPPGPVFSDCAVVPWRLGRAFLWSPYDASVEAQIRGVVPALRDAPWVRIRPVREDR